MKPVQEIRVGQESVNDETVQIVALHVENGTRIFKGDPVVEIETSKANLTLEAECEGYVSYAFEVGDEVAVGRIIARIYPSPPPASPDFTAERELTQHEFKVAKPIFSAAAMTALRELDLSENQFSGIPFVTEELVRQFQGEQEAPGFEAEPADNFDPASLRDLRDYLRADVFRYRRQIGFWVSFRCFFKSPGFRCTWYFRTRKYLRRRPLARLFFGPILSFFGNREARRYGIRIPISASIGRGLLIGHWGGIWINPNAVIGANCNLNNDVSIGSAGPAAKRGHPNIGDRVFIGPGARISGAIRIGDDSVISANTFLTKSLGPRSVAVGVPATVSSGSGSQGFINDIWDPEALSENL